MLLSAPAVPQRPAAGVQAAAGMLVAPLPSACHPKAPKPAPACPPCVLCAACRAAMARLAEQHGPGYVVTEADIRAATQGAMQEALRGRAM